MSLRRGFKTEANEYSREFRQELDLATTAPLCPWRLAEHLCIPVVALSSLRPEIPIEVDFLLAHGGEIMSAATVSSRCRRAILYNDANAKVRQASDIAHELGHAILGHPTTLPFNDSGQRIVNKEHENEAAWLGAALLVSDEAAISVAQSERPLEISAAEYGVSVPLLRMRLNVTGANKRVRRWEAARKTG